MSEMEKKMVENLRKLPVELQQRFADRIKGAALALEAMKQDEKKSA